MPTITRDTLFGKMWIENHICSIIHHTLARETVWSRFSWVLHDHVLALCWLWWMTLFWIKITKQKWTLQVNAKCVQDGDSVIVYVSTADPRESLNVPPQVSLAAVKRSKARTKKNYDKADTLHEKIISAGYRLNNHVFFTTYSRCIKHSNANVPKSFCYYYQGIEDSGWGDSCSKVSS